MKDIKISFPYPSTSRHNLSQDISTSLSMGLVTPIRVVKVLPGDSHRIATSFSLVSNPLVKPLLQGVRLRYCRFWVPSRIYNIDQRANNSNFSPLDQPVRVGRMGDVHYPLLSESNRPDVNRSNFQQSSLFDYLGLAPYESNIYSNYPAPTSVAGLDFTLAGASPRNFYDFNAEPYLGYIDICRNYFSDSANHMIAWASRLDVTSSGAILNSLGVVVTPLSYLDDYIDGVQNSRSLITPYDITGTKSGESPDWFDPFVLKSGSFYNVGLYSIHKPRLDRFSAYDFGSSHNFLCVPLNRPDRLSRLFNTSPLISQNATVSPSEITIANLSFLAKLQRYLTRRFFGGSRFTDIMYSVFGQKVPHVDSPVLLDVFDHEIGSELVVSTNATSTQNPGVLGGYFSSAGVLETGRGRSRKRYSFNENGYIIDVAYIMPRINRASFIPDFYPVVEHAQDPEDTTFYTMQQGNFVPDFNGIGWQQPTFVSHFINITDSSGTLLPTRVDGFCCEPSWQQYRTLPDVCHGAMNPLRGLPSTMSGLSILPSSLEVNSPLFTFNDRMDHNSVYYRVNDDRYMLASQMYTSFHDLNSVFGTEELTIDNFFVVFRYAHQAKRQVSKRFTLSFN